MKSVERLVKCERRPRLLENPSPMIPQVQSKEASLPIREFRNDSGPLTELNSDRNIFTVVNTVSIQTSADENCVNHIELC